MLKLENINILNNIVSCTVICQDGTVMSLSVPVYNWENISFSDPSQKIDACHARNKLYRDQW